MILLEQTVRAIKVSPSLVGLGRAKELLARRLTRAILIKKAIASKVLCKLQQAAVIWFFEGSRKD